MNEEKVANPNRRFAIALYFGMVIATYGILIYAINQGVKDLTPISGLATLLLGGLGTLVLPADPKGQIADAISKGVDKTSDALAVVLVLAIGGIAIAIVVAIIIQWW